ncbi:UNVERIFIED_ORG: hypothetical protein B2H93_13525 [Clostridium botulinum]
MKVNNKFEKLKLLFDKCNNEDLFIGEAYRCRIPYGYTNIELASDLNKILGTTYRESYLRGKGQNFNKGRDFVKSDNKFDNSIMIINDIHAPYEREDLLESISKHSDEIDTLIINGDYLDCHSISSFSQVKETSLKDEVVYGYYLLKKIRKILNRNQKIIMNCGNHEKRYFTNISKMNEKDLQTFINPEILEMYTEGFTLYVDGKKKKYEPIEGLIYIPHWYMVVDGIVVCHPLTFSQSKGKMLENISSYFVNLGIDFTLAVLGHTHKYSAGITERFSNKSVIENCCMCKPQKYSDCGKTSYSPQTYGYTIIKYNKCEKVTLNNCKTYILEESVDTVSDYIVEI